jgi:hypothetical protein
MKNLSLVSFIGIDHHTDFNDLLEFKNPKNNMDYEFGVLYSDSKNDRDIRYPGYDFCLKFLSWAKINDISRSIHICGSSIDSYLKEDPQILKLCNELGDYNHRIQLNIDKYHNNEELADNIINVTTKYGHNLILQKNELKEKFNKVFVERTEILHPILEKFYFHGFMMRHVVLEKK